MPIKFTRRGVLLMLPGFSTGMLLGGTVALAPGVDNAVAKDGATFPLYGAATYPQAFYDTDSNKTSVAWEAWAEGGRAQHTTNLDHSAGYFGDIEAMSVSTLPNDDHGNPAIVLDHENHLHSFYGCHGNTIGSTGMQHSSTRWPVDEIGDGGSKWTIRPQITGSYTYPNPFMVGSTMHLVMRKTIRAQTRHPLVRYATSALADGVATWGSEITIVDFGADSRVYAGNGVLIGTDWHFCCTKADNKDTIRVNVYYFILDTTTGDIKNHDGSVTIAAADLPVDLTESDADFRLFTHSGGNGGYIPWLAFDTGGNPFVAFSDGTETSYAINVIKRTNRTWGAPERAASTDNRFGTFALGQLPSGQMELFYEADPGAAWARGGDLTRKVRSAAGSWGSAETILAARTFALGLPTIVQNGHSGARVMFAEHRQVSTDPARGELKVYLWGTAGLVGYRQAPATPPASADSVEVKVSRGLAERSGKTA